MRVSASAAGGLVLLVAVGMGCGSSGSAGLFDDDAGAGGDGTSSSGSDAGSLHDGGASSSSGGGSGSGSGGSSGSGSSSGTSSGGSSSGTAITCPAPGSPKSSGACGTERWDIKTGTDSQAGSVSLVPQPTTIATLRALAANGGGSSRETPTETTLFELKDVTLTEWLSESDSDYHLVLTQGGVTMIAEIPGPSCTATSVWKCFISRARAEFEMQNLSQYPGLTVTVRGVGFFDFLHGQTGVAPNGIEVHPVLQICFGQGCTPS